MIINVANDPEPPCPVGLSYVLNMEILLGSILETFENSSAVSTVLSARGGGLAQVDCDEVQCRC